MRSSPLTKDHDSFLDRSRFPRISESLQSEFSAKIKSLTDPPKPFSDAELQNLQRDLTFSFKTKGYFSASVTVTPNFHGAADGRVPITGRCRAWADLSVWGIGGALRTPTARLRPEFLTETFRSTFAAKPTVRTN